jgi:hypothetical protein
LNLIPEFNSFINALERGGISILEKWYYQ